LTPLTLRGRSVGIAGLGRIGRAIAHRCEAFGLPVSYFGRTKKDDVPYPFYTDLVEMAAAVDTMILVTPGTAETQDMVNADVLAALGANGVLINIARGSVVDETALIEALRANTIAAAGLDVMKNEPNIDPTLMTLENCVLLPHVGSASLPTRIDMGSLVINNLKAMVNGQPPLTPVPETPFTGW
ncbi:MAG: NAD(P)-dependent oxidoreductase, partial [Pseudomonadota bacterium]